ncbi:unnamed protein product [Camellia sinensis]
MTYGRLIGRSVIAEFASSRYPLYFAVRQHNEVMSTEQPCDLAYEFGDGFLGINEYPPGFPRPACWKPLISSSKVLRILWYQ